jgi:hypothetical protein
MCAGPSSTTTVSEDLLDDAQTSREFSADKGLSGCRAQSAFDEGRVAGQE